MSDSDTLVTVAFEIEGELGSAAEITARTGVEPSWIIEKGISPRSKRVHKTFKWVVKTSPRDQHELGDLWQDFSDIIRSEAFMFYVDNQDYKKIIFIYIDMMSIYHYDFVLPDNLISFSSKYNIELRITKDVVK